MLLEARSLAFSYGRRKILDNVSMKAESGSMTALLGRNGSGKTTLLRLLLGFLKPLSGTIEIDGRNTAEMSSRERASAIAYIPQNTGMVYSYTVLDTVLMGRAPTLSIFSRPGRKDEEKAFAALDTLGIASLSNRSVSRLSGGERQLVMIARALAQNAGILLLDEPTASLDYSNQLLVMETMENLRNAGYAIIFSTHSPEQALMNATDVIAISGGRISFAGKPDELLDGRVLEELYSRDLFIKRIDTGRSSRIICVPR